MSDYIKREDAVERIAKCHIGGLEGLRNDMDFYSTGLREAVDAIEDCPSADVEPVRHGYWIEKNTNKDGTHNIYCNKCGKYIKSKGHANSWRVRNELLYCPHCGARMDGDKDVELSEVLKCHDKDGKEFDIGLVKGFHALTLDEAALKKLEKVVDDEL